MKIDLVTLNPVVGNKQKNFEKIKEVCLKSESDLLVFGELFLTGYCERADWKKNAEGLSGEYLKKLSDLAKKTRKNLVIGCPVLENGKLYNCSILFKNSGDFKIYRKNYLPHFGLFKEGNYFSEGKGIDVFKVENKKISLCICYDTYFPELWKIAALKGSELMICISASPYQTKHYFETTLPARALENTFYVVYVNLVGKQDDNEFWGGSRVYGPWGNPICVSPPYQERIDQVEIDFGQIESARKLRPTLKDTRGFAFDELKKLARMVGKDV
jgi:predicted amidohydrolase